MKYRSAFILISAIGALARPVQDVLEISKPRPLVIWHGLGDSYDSSGIVKFQSYVEEMYPGIFIHSVNIDPNSKKDRRATFYGNVDEQVELVADQLQNIPQLSKGFDAIGFSQGGLFLRAYAERHNDPPIRNLITFGSPHMGISEIPSCPAEDTLCNIVRNAARLGVYTKWAQSNLVQAQYFRDTGHFERYLESNHFLTSINNELPAPDKDAAYAKHFKQLDTLVLVRFTEDVTVVPKESAWFGSYRPKEEEDDALRDFFELGRDEEVMKAIVPMRKQPLYVEDWIGLRTLDESGRVKLASCHGAHMHLSTECWRPLVEKYVGSHP